MKHYGSSHSRSEIGRALGKIAEVSVKGDSCFFLKRLVKFQRFFICILKGKTGKNDLNAGVVFFTQHYAYVLVLGKEQRTSVRVGSKFRAYQMLFRKRNGGDRGKRFHFGVGEFFTAVRSKENIAHYLVDLFLFHGAQTRRKGIILKVACKSYSCAEDNVRMFAFV